MTLEELAALRARELANPRTAAMSRLVGNAMCGACRLQKRETIAFDARKDGSAAILICDECLAAKIALPVLLTCGPCRHLVSNPARGGLFCAREQRALETDVKGRPVEPPSWCPLRGAQ